MEFKVSDANFLAIPSPPRNLFNQGGRSNKGRGRGGAENRMSSKDDAATITDRSIGSVCKYLGLPDEVCKSYMATGLKELYPWQVDCLCNETHVLVGNNLVYCAPTSGGKTLVAEMIILRTVLILKKRVLLVLPFVSLVLDKEKYFVNLVKGYNRSCSNSRDRIKVKGFYGHERRINPKVKHHISICTIEKANGILNSFISTRNATALGCVVIDEMHTLGSTFNGYLLEILVSKLRLLQYQATMAGFEGIKIQMLGMSATVGNIQALSHWFGGDLFMTTFRPVPLSETIVAGEISYNTKKESMGSIHTNCFGHYVKEYPSIMPCESKVLNTLCIDGLKKGQPVLIFCPTKLACQQVCKQLTTDLPIYFGYIVTHNRDTKILEQLAHSRQRIIDDMEALNPNVEIEPTFIKGIEFGIAYHHSNISSKLKQIIEEAYYNGIISIIIATTTLAAGVNLPAGRVLIKSLTVGKDNLEVAQYKQMIGRAGRAGQAAYGEAFLVVKKHELDSAADLVNRQIPDVTSQIHPVKDGGKGLMGALLEVNSLDLLRNNVDLDKYIEQTLMFHETPVSAQDEIKRISRDLLSFLVDAHAIIPSLENDERVYKTSRFGRAVVSSGLSPDEAIVVYRDLMLAEQGLNLQNSLHVLYLTTPLNHHLRPDFCDLFKWFDKYREGDDSNLRVFFATMKFTDNFGILYNLSFKCPDRESVARCFEASRQFSLRRWNDRTCGKDSTMGSLLTRYSEHEWDIICKCKRVWAARVLSALVDGEPMVAAARRFQADINDLEHLQNQAKMLLTKVLKFCAEIGASALEKLFKHFKSRLDFDSPNEVTSLMVIPGMTRKTAKVLHESKPSISSISDLLAAPIANIVNILHLSTTFRIPDLKLNVAAATSTKDVTANDKTKSRIFLYVERLVSSAKAIQELELDEEIKSNEDNMVAPNALSKSIVQSAISTQATGIPDDTSVSEGESMDESSTDEEGSSDDDISDEESKRKFSRSGSSDLDDSFDEKTFMNITSKPNWMPTGKDRSAGREIHSETIKVALTPIPECPIVVVEKDDIVYNITQEDDSPLHAVAKGGLSVRNSPVLTPYRPSQLRTPGKYLYLPQIHESYGESNGGASFVFAADLMGCDKQAGFGWKHVSLDEHCRLFIQKLRGCRCISFELVFSGIPFAHSPEQTIARGSSSGGEEIRKKIISRWSDVIAWSCPHSSSKAFGGVSSINTNAIDSSEGLKQNDPHVIAGIAIHFLSDEYAFYMPLPTLPPQLSGVPSSPLDNKAKSNFGTSKTELTICCLPPIAKELIGRYVGFNRILCKCPYLRSTTTVYQSNNTNIDTADIANNNGNSNNVNAHVENYEGNPLMSVSRDWAATSRNALRTEWAIGNGGVEWNLVNEIMGNEKVTKVAMDMKQKLVCLRERDVLLRGPLEDPSVARALLPVTAGKDTQKIKIPRLPNLQLSLNTGRQMIAIKRACFRSIAIMRLMKRISAQLVHFNAMSLFRNVEMPVLYSIADAEYSGLPIDAHFFHNLRSEMLDRTTIISHLIQMATKDPQFNPLSKQCVKNLEVRLEEQYKSTVHHHNSEEINIQNHPLLQIIHEFRRCNNIVPICNGIFRSKFKNRVRANYLSIGSETGRIIVTQPNLQNVQKECLYKPIKRYTILQEIKKTSKDATMQYIYNLNYEITCSKRVFVRVLTTNTEGNQLADFSVGLLCFVYDPSMQATDDFVNFSTIRSSFPTADALLSKSRETGDRILAAVQLLYGGGLILADASNVYRIDGSKVDIPSDEIIKDAVLSTDWVEKYTSDLNSVSPRSGFVAEKGNILISADYSQMELRLLAHFSNDPMLISSFKLGEDVFRCISAMWTGRQESDVLPAERDSMKKLCYALIYGGGVRMIQNELGNSLEDAQELYNSFMVHHMAISRYIQEMKSFCEANSYVETILGRRRYLTDISCSDADGDERRARAQRQVLSTICQGSAADIVKLAMVNIRHKISEIRGISDGPRSRPGGSMYRDQAELRLVLQVHDELVFEVPEARLPEAVQIVHTCMENSLELVVPLRVNIKFGKSLGTLKEYKL